MRIGLQTSHANAIALGEAATGGGAELNLPLVDWEGGPDYWTVAQNGAKMTKAEAAGWSDPSFFPIATWLSPAERAQDMLDIGINVMMAADHDVSHQPPSAATALGMFVIPQSNEWTPGDIGSDPLCVGWHTWDEPELFTTLATYESDVDDVRALNDGRFVHTNFAQVILNTFWWFGQASDAFAVPDFASVDHYYYTAQNVRQNTTNPPADAWPLTVGNDALAQKAATYGWAVDRMRHWGGSGKPYWMYVETQMPFLTDSNGDLDIILYAQIRGAVWTSIVHEARGILYFQQNGFYNAVGAPTTDPNTGLAPNQALFSLIDGDAALASYVSTLNAQITSLAPVLNTQSFEFDFGATGIDTMLKAKDGYAYIFTCLGLGASTGSKTFTLTGTGITGTTVEVVDESRTVNVSGGQFTDSFANEYSQHIYKIPI